MMNLTEIKNLVNIALHNEPCTFIKLFFISKKRLKNGTRYSLYQAPLSSNLNRKLLEIIENGMGSFEDYPIRNYEYLGVEDDVIERINCDLVREAKSILDAINDAQSISHYSNETDVAKIDFYCFQLILNGNVIYFFRQFSKMKALRKNGTIMAFFEDRFDTIESNIISIDGSIDAVISDDILYLFNHISLERIFSFKDVIIENSNIMIKEIQDSNIIQGFEQFKEDCLKDFRRSKWLAKIKLRGGLTVLNANKEKIPDIIKEINDKSNANLSYEEGKFVYNDVPQLSWILGMIGNNCIKKFLSGEIGISIIEKEFE